VKILNKRAKFKYAILEKVEAGIVLVGSEVKSIRASRADLSESFARIRDGEVFLLNAYINPWMGSEKYKQSFSVNKQSLQSSAGPAGLKDTRRERKLLLSRRQILNWQGKIAGSKLTLVPLSIYIKGNLAKVELALAKNKAKYDKRETLKKKTIDRDIDRDVRGAKE